MSRKPKDPYSLTPKQLKEIAKAEQAYKNEKERRIKIISTLCSVCDKRFYFKPWMETLQEKFKKDPSLYQICLKDSHVIIPYFKYQFPELKTNIFDIISSMDWKEYALLERDFLFVLDCVKESVSEALKECEKSNKFGKGSKQFVLPTLEEIETIEKVFDKEGNEEYNRNYGLC
jgi:hypothetical protein